MFFVSTRDSKILCNFKDAFLKIIPKQQCGVFVPSFISTMNDDEIILISKQSYKDILIRILSMIFEKELDLNIVKYLVEDAFKNFNQGFGGNKLHINTNYNDIITSQTLEKNVKIMNLTHGPTGCCKDYGYCLSASIINYLAEHENRKRAIIDISNDNSNISTAWAVKDKKFLKSFILLNKSQNNVNKILLSLAIKNSSNIDCVAVDSDYNFLNKICYDVYNNTSLCEMLDIAFINENNLICVFAYLPIFFKAYAECNNKPFCVSIPTNNMTIGISAFFAKKLGVPIRKIILSTENNDFLFKIQENKNAIDSKITDSCMMFYSGIPVNFERLLFYLYGANQSSVKRTMQELESGRNYKMSDSLVSKLKKIFYISHCDNQFTIRDTIHSLIKEKELYVEQHLALAKIGLNNAINAIPDEIENNPIIILNTLDYRRNIDFVNTSIGYNLEHVEYPWNNDEKPCQITEIKQDSIGILHYIVDSFEKK